MGLKIFGTLGPACHETKQLADMLEAGMNAARINLSHMTLQEAAGWIDNLHQAMNLTQKPCHLVVDLQGREFRILDMEDMMLEKGKTYCLPDDIPIDEPLRKCLMKGDLVLLEDGKKQIHIDRVEPDKVWCTSLSDGLLKGRTNFKIKDRTTDLPPLSAQDIENLKLAGPLGVEGVMVPFVQKAEDLAKIKKILLSLNLKLRIYAKIEDHLGVFYLESLFPHCDEIVIARGDLGNDFPMETLPWIQMNLEKRCKTHQVPYMVVTQMLESMREKPVCTRAEANDVFMAVYNGAASIMLTAETASSKYPLEAMEQFCSLAQKASAARKLHTNP